MDGREEEGAGRVVADVHVSVGRLVCSRVLLWFEKHEASFVCEAMFGQCGAVQRLSAEGLDGVGVEGFNLHCEMTFFFFFFSLFLCCCICWCRVLDEQ